MKRSGLLTGTSLLSILLPSLHLADDIVYGSDRSSVLNVVAAAVLAVWLYGTLVLAERRSGHIIMLLGSVVGIIVFTIHVSKLELSHLPHSLGARGIAHAAFEGAERCDDS